VTGFHRGAKPPVTGFSQLERRLKPAPHKNVGINHSSRKPRDTNSSKRLLDHGTGAKSRARRTRAVAQASSSTRRDLLLLNQHRKCLVSFDVVLTMVSCKYSQVNSALYAKIIFGGTSSNKHYKPVTQSSEHMFIYCESRLTGVWKVATRKKRRRSPQTTSQQVARLDQLVLVMMTLCGRLWLRHLELSHCRQLPPPPRDVCHSFDVMFEPASSDAAK
jgi:hypothetical protein